VRSEGPLAIVAGGGRLPVELAHHLERQGRDIRILALRGFADRALQRRAHTVCDALDPGRILACLDEWSPHAVTLAGSVARPGLSTLVAAFSALRRADELRDLFARGDDQVLRTFVSWLEERGIVVVGPHELMPELAAPLGFRAGAAVAGEHRDAIATALDLLDALSPYDVGQAVVVAGRRVLAVEGPEGTDRMLRRVARTRRRWPGHGWFSRRREGGVLVKAPKRTQDLRVDMPAIGPRTIAEAARAGLAGIAVGAGCTLVLDRDATIRAVDKAGLFLVSVDLPWAGAQS